jgi:CheY-like chemotaxis protein
MDVSLPGMNGVEAARILGASPSTRDIAIIGLSAGAKKHERSAAENAGLFRYLTKPLDMDEMVDALHAALVRVEA